MNGQTLPGAWDVELDIPVISADTPQGGAFFRVWGVSLAEINQANNLNGFNIVIAAGMQKGLPLANPSQARVICTGYVLQALGNWIGTDMTLDLVIYPGQASSSTPGGIGTLRDPKNIVLNWQGGTPLSEALQATLSAAYPGTKMNINISPQLALPAGSSSPWSPGYYPTFQQLAQGVRQLSTTIVKTTGYRGVSMWFGPDGTLNVSDGTQQSGGGTASTTKMINFTDLIGQPTWLEAPTIQVKTVMRGDINVLDTVMLPPTQVTNTQQSASYIVNQKAAFQGAFTVTSVRHVGRYRQPPANSWASIFDMVPNSGLG